jgi:hypothetical protein
MKDGLDGLDVRSIAPKGDVIIVGKLLLGEFRYGLGRSH